MSKRFRLSKLLIVMLMLANLPITQAQTYIRPGRNEGRRLGQIPISAYEDDPFVRAADVKQMSAERFGLDEAGDRWLWSYSVTLSEEDFIYRRDTPTSEFKKFAWNPWPLWTPANAQGDFRFQDEARFPLFKQERDADGKLILKDGLQVWTPNDLHLGDTTAFEAASAAKDAAEAWAGRDIRWGVNGTLNIEPHAFIDLNAFYSPSARELFFGVVPYRLPGTTDIKIFESATSWDMVTHESGHALHNALKPNTDHGLGFTAWSESFGDQMVMWASLRGPLRRQHLLAETKGNFDQSNSLSRQCEAWAALVGIGTGVRDSFNDLKISDTTEEVHDRSQPLTGATYSIFLNIYNGLKQEHEADEALRLAGNVMGTFLVRATDYTPENEVTLEEVAKAYLKVDKEFFGGRYHATLMDEFIRREIFDANSEHEWQVHEDSLPYLYLSRQATDQEIEDLLRANLDLFGIGQDFGLKLQSVIREERRGQTIVHAQLTLGRGDGASLLNNHAILVFRADGLLADYHAPLAPYLSLQMGQSQARPQARETIQLRSLISQAKRFCLDQHGAPLSIVRKADGQWSVEARVLWGEGLNSYLEVFTPDNPLGKRHEIMIPPVPPDKRIPIADDLLK